MVGSYYLVYDLAIFVTYHATYDRLNLPAECVDIKSHQVQMLLEHMGESELLPLCGKYVAAALVNAIKGQGRPADFAALLLSKSESQSFLAKGLKQSTWLAKTLAQCSTVPFTELNTALCAAVDNGGQQCEIMSFFHKDKCGAKLMAVAMLLEKSARPSTHIKRK